LIVLVLTKIYKTVMSNHTKAHPFSYIKGIQDNPLLKAIKKGVRNLPLAKNKRGSSLKKPKRRMASSHNKNVIVIKHENSGKIRLKDIIKFEGRQQMVQ